MMNLKIMLLLPLMVLIAKQTMGQQFLGTTRNQVLAAHTNCTAMNSYDQMLVLNCGGLKQIYYFNGKDSICDMYAFDTGYGNATDTIQHLQAQGFKQVGTKYIEAFLKLKSSTHQKFPARIYRKGNVEYFFMPVSLNGKSANLNAVIVKYAANQPQNTAR